MLVLYQIKVFSSAGCNTPLCSFISIVNQIVIGILILFVLLFDLQTISEFCIDNHGAVYWL